MKKYLALLRGINVGKSKRISKGDLADLFESLGFEDVSVFIQSGNVVFKAAGTSSALAEAITSQFKKQLSYDVPAVVLDASKFGKIVEANPFKKEAKIDASKVLIGFYNSSPTLDALKDLDSKPYAPNSFLSEKQATYLYCPDGVGRAKLPKFEKLLGTAITFRNARVCNELLKIMNA